MKPITAWAACLGACLGACTSAVPDEKLPKKPQVPALREERAFGVTPVPHHLARTLTPGGLATGTDEDLVLLNDSARYTFERTTDARAQGAPGLGGGLLAGSLVDAQGFGGGQDGLLGLTPGVVLPGSGLIPAAAREVHIEEDPSGGALRLSGAVTTADGGRVELETRVVLLPDQPHLLLKTTLTNAGDKPITCAPGDELRFGRGWSSVGAGKKTVAWLAHQTRGQSYGYALDGQATFQARGLGEGEVVEVSAPPQPLAPKQSLTFTRRFLASADGAGGVKAWAAALLGAQPGRLQLAVRAQGKPLPPELVHLELYEGGQRLPTGTLPVKSGPAVDVPLAPGSYRVVAPGPWRGASLEVQVKPGQPTQAALDLAPLYPLALAVVERVDKKPLSASVLVQRADGSPVWRGPGYEAQGAGAWSFLPSGAGELWLPEGRYKVTASRGPEYDLDVQEVEVRAGTPARYAGALGRAISTPNAWRADLRVYSEEGSRGISSRAGLTEALVCQGVEVAGLADEPLPLARPPEALAVPGLLEVLVGREADNRDPATGRFLALQAPEDAQGWGALPSRGMNASTLLSNLRPDGPQPAPWVVALEPHARDKGGFLDLYPLDPQTAKPQTENPLADPAPGALPTGTDRLDALELTLDDLRALARGQETPALQSWIARARQGRKTAPFAASGASRLGLDPVGLPFLWVAADPKAKSPTPDAARSALREGRVVASTGPYLSLRVEGQGPGQLAVARRKRDRKGNLSAPEASFWVEARGPAWMNIKEVELYVDGRTMRRWELPPQATKNGATVWEEKFSEVFSAERDLWFYAVVRGEVALPGGEVPAVALTAPVWLDADADRLWRPF